MADCTFRSDTGMLLCSCLVTTFVFVDLQSSPPSFFSFIPRFG